MITAYRRQLLGGQALDFLVAHALSDLDFLGACPLVFKRRVWSPFILKRGPELRSGFLGGTEFWLRPFPKQGNGRLPEGAKSSFIGDVLIWYYPRAGNYPQDIADGWVNRRVRHKFRGADQHVRESSPYQVCAEVFPLVALAGTQDFRGAGIPPAAIESFGG
jgi:hypothetical protein